MSSFVPNCCSSNEKEQVSKEGLFIGQLPLKTSTQKYEQFVEKGRKLYAQNKSQLAEQQYQFARREFQKQHQDVPLQNIPQGELQTYLSVVHQHAVIYQKLGCQFDVLVTSKLQLRIQQCLKGQDRIEVAIILDKIAEICFHRQKYPQALQNFQRSLKIQQKLIEGDTEEKTNLLNKLGKVYKLLNYETQALEHFLKSLQMYQRLNGPNSIHCASILNSIGLIYKGQGLYPLALQQFLKCLNVQSNLHGKDSIESATTLYNIGSVYYSQRNYPQALEKYQRCLSIQQAIKGEGSIATASTLNNIGLTFRNQGNFPMALESFYKCLDIQEKFKGKQSVESAQTLNNIGEVYRNFQAYFKCLQFQQKTQKGFVVPSSTLTNIDKSERNKLTFNKAIECYMKSISIYESLNIQSRGHALVLFNLGGAYYHLKEYKLASQSLQKSLNIYKENKIIKQAKSCAFALTKCLIQLYEFEQIQLIIKQYGLNASELQEI